MKLYSKEFEKSLERGVKEAIRQSPELEKQYKRSGKSSKGFSSGPSFAGGLSVFMACFPVLKMAKAGDLAAGLVALAIASFTSVTLAATVFWAELYNSHKLAPMFHMPVDESEIFNWRVKKNLLSQIPALVILIVVLALLGSIERLPAAKLLGIEAVGILTWLSWMALAINIAAFAPRKICGLVGLVGVMICVALMVESRMDMYRVMAMLDRYALETKLLLPTGWPLFLFDPVLSGSVSVTIVILVPIGLLFWSVPSALVALRRNFGYKEFTLPFIRDQVPAITSEGAATQSQSNAPDRRWGKTDIEDYILSRQLFAGPSWLSKGPMERWFWKWLTPREQVLADFVFPRGGFISACWRAITKAALIVVALGIVTGSINKPTAYFITGVGLTGALLFALAVALGSGHAFHPTYASGTSVPAYTFFGVGYGELSKLLMKYTLVQTPALLGFVMPIAVLLAWNFHGPILVGVGVALKLTFIILASRFILLPCRFSQGTSNSRRFSLSAVAMMVAMAVAILIFIVAAISGVVWPSWWGVLLCGIAAGDAIAVHYLYGKFYKYGRFDLTRPTRK